MSRRGPGKFAMSVAIVATLIATILSPTLSAQTDVNPSTTRPVNRYLFIVETSRAMQPRARGVFDAIKHALDSSLNGEIHQGDLVGIWTFNEVVYQELFPAQVWSQPTQLAFAVRLPTFADPESYQRRGRLDKVVPEMLKVFAGNENITVILVTTGDGVLQGTPFDAQINSSWKEWYAELDGIHMPLQTVIRVKNAQPVAWFMTPAPRPIDLARLETVPKSDGQKQNNPAGVILESGPVTNQPSSLGNEQQVAFSVWALGQTSLVASASSPQKIPTPQPKTSDSPSSAPDSATNIPNSQPSSTLGPQADPSKRESAAVPSTSNSPTADNGKPVELVFVTNATAAAPATESPIKETPPVTPPSVSGTPPSPAASSIADVPANNHMVLAHARAADLSQEEKQSANVALATPPRGFLRDNIKPLLLMIVAGFGAIYCFRMWLRTNARSIGNTVSLTRAGEGE